MTVTFRHRGCHDCVLRGICKECEQNYPNNPDYSCPNWDWRYD